MRHVCVKTWDVLGPVASAADRHQYVSPKGTFPDLTESPEIVARYASLSRRFPPFMERQLKHTACVVMRRSVQCGREIHQFRPYVEAPSFVHAWKCARQSFAYA